MKKFLLCLICLLLLSGCYQAKDINSEVDMTLRSLENVKSKKNANHLKKFYQYYLPTNVFSLESKDTYNIFKDQQFEFAMNLDIARIINKKYYHTTELVDSHFIYLKDYLILEKKDHVLNSDYRLSIYQCDDLYLIDLTMNNVVLNACVRLNYVKDVLRNMFIIGDSVKTDDYEIIDKFSNKDVIEYHKEKIDLFKVIIPKDGRLEELINPKSNFDIDSQNNNPVEEVIDEEER